jgi:predicted nuclease of restriction endonuclease-like (RecB) superfamily
MMQFFETYRGQPKLATLVRELSWSHNLAILSRSKREEEREFYLLMAIRERWSFRELQRQLNGALFERTVLAPPKLSTSLAELHPEAATVFKDTYILEFLDLPTVHSEADLQRGLVEKLKQFLIELGRDFCFVGSYYPIQVGGRDFEIDLLFFLFPDSATDGDEQRHAEPTGLPRSARNLHTILKNPCKFAPKGPISWSSWNDAKPEIIAI